MVSAAQGAAVTGSLCVYKIIFEDNIVGYGGPGSERCRINSKYMI